MAKVESRLETRDKEYFVLKADYQQLKDEFCNEKETQSGLARMKDHL